MKTSTWFHLHPLGTRKNVFVGDGEGGRIVLGISGAPGPQSTAVTRGLTPEEATRLAFALLAFAGNALPSPKSSPAKARAAGC